MEARLLQTLCLPWLLPRLKLIDFLRYLLYPFKIFPGCPHSRLCFEASSKCQRSWEIFISHLSPAETKVLAGKPLSIQNINLDSLLCEPEAFCRLWILLDSFSGLSGSVLDSGEAGSLWPFPRFHSRGDTGIPAQNFSLKRSQVRRIRCYSLQNSGSWHLVMAFYRQS